MTNVHDEITISKASKVKPNVKIGEAIEIEVTPKNFGRIAAQTAKQAMMQRIRQAEKEMIYDEFKDRAGEIVSGTVRRFERSDVVIDLGKFEATMPMRERVQTEDYNIGDRIRAYVLAVENGPRGPEIVLSRSHPNFVRRLFEVEVSEIADRTVEIKRHRPRSRLPHQNRGPQRQRQSRSRRRLRRHARPRVKNIVRELNNEKVDIIRWSADPKEFVLEALKPAKIKGVTLDEAKKAILIKVDEDQFSLAIGKRGQNARLTSRLTGWDINIEQDKSRVEVSNERVGKASTRSLAEKLTLSRPSPCSSSRAALAFAEILPKSSRRTLSMLARILADRHSARESRGNPGCGETARPKKWPPSSRS